MSDVGVLIPIFSIVLATVWVILHYVTRWKTAPTLTRDDEVMLEELYQVARRLDERMDTVERLVAADDPNFKPTPLMPDREIDNHALDELERLRKAKERSAR
jgi:phage shock protein B